MVEGVLVPDALLIEDEQLPSRHITEHQILIKHVTRPHKLVRDHLCVHLFQVFDVDNILLSSTKEEGLLEHNLLGVRKHLCMPAEICLLCPSTRDECE